MKRMEKVMMSAKKTARRLRKRRLQTQTSRLQKVRMCSSCSGSLAEEESDPEEDELELERVAPKQGRSIQRQKKTQTACPTSEQSPARMEQMVMVGPRRLPWMTQC